MIAIVWHLFVRNRWRKASSISSLFTGRYYLFLRVCASLFQFWLVFLDFLTTWKQCFWLQHTFSNIVAHAVSQGCQSLLFSVEIFASQLSFKNHCEENCVTRNFQMPVDILSKVPVTFKLKDKLWRSKLNEKQAEF